jgi:hypothetical protein
VRGSLRAPGAREVPDDVGVAQEQPDAAQHRRVAEHALALGAEEAALHGALEELVDVHLRAVEAFHELERAVDLELAIELRDLLPVRGGDTDDAGDAPVERAEPPVDRLDPLGVAADVRGDLRQRVLELLLVDRRVGRRGAGLAVGVAAVRRGHGTRAATLRAALPALPLPLREVVAAGGLHERIEHVVGIGPVQVLRLEAH